MYVSQETYAEGLNVAICVVAWLALYLIVRHVLCPRLSADGANRVISLLHAFLGFAWPLMVINFSRLREDVGSATTPEQIPVLRMSLSYFVYDMLCCVAIELSEGRFDAATFFHHVASITGMSVGLFKRMSAHELLLCLLLMEASNPFMHLRMIMRELQWPGAKIRDYNDITFALMFLLCRHGLGTFVMYWTVVSKTSHPLVKLGAVGIELVTYFWTGKLLSLIYRKAIAPKKQVDAGKVE